MRDKDVGNLVVVFIVQKTKPLTETQMSTIESVFKT